MIKYDSNISVEELDTRMYEILKKSLELNKNPIVREDNIPRFEEVARKLDDKLSIEYDKKIDKLFYTTSTIEEEKERLEKVVSLMGNRLEQRRELCDDFENITSKQLMGLMEIKYLDEVDYYQDRLKLINEYLENLAKIDITNKDIKTINEDLNNEYNKKEINEETNAKLEDKLLSTFLLDINDVEISLDDNKIVKLAEYLKNANLEIELSNIASKVDSSKSSYDTYVNSYNALKKSGALFDNENDEYFMEGVREAGKQYYAYKEQEYMLFLYKEISSKVYEYTPFIEKREKINAILSERNKLREEVFINAGDSLVSLPELLIEQQNDISNQKDSYSNINRLSERLKYKEDKLSKLIEDNNRVEILSLLEEYGLVEVEEDEIVYDELPTFEEFMLDNPIELKEDTKTYAPNEIKNIKETSNMNADAINKSKDVMSKVAKMLNVNVAPKEIDNKDNKYIPKVEEKTEYIDLENTLVLPNIEQMPELPKVDNAEPTFDFTETAIPAEKTNDEILQSVQPNGEQDIKNENEEKEPDLILPIDLENGVFSTENSAVQPKAEAPTISVEPTETVELKVEDAVQPKVEASSVSVEPTETSELKVEAPASVVEDTIQSKTEAPASEVIKTEVPFASKEDNAVPFWIPIEEKKTEVVNSWDNNLAFSEKEEIKATEVVQEEIPSIAPATDISTTVAPEKEEIKATEVVQEEIPSIAPATDISTTSGGNAPVITNNNEFTFPTFDVAEVQNTLESGNPRVLKPSA